MKAAEGMIRGKKIKKEQASVNGTFLVTQ